ncbi:tripartite tricarboxylate transporter substrate-binding protein [Humitalea sp. 24SJ18S-53]|uniref:tripartite tricarboxylate transporter substrate-binding protein n=1 Tax=Humitalea sp. 24SJ18S-53 TaxID=3422307 RepID=UPI003D67E74A
MPVSIGRRGLVLGGGAALAMPTMARAAWQARPITLVHGFGGGGTADGVARILAEGLSSRLGLTVVVEARPGAGGTIAARGVAKSSAPNGHTLILLTGGHTVVAAMYKALPYNTLEDFTYVGLSGFGGPFVLFVARDSAFQTPADVIVHARANPGTLTYGSSGIGTTGHLTMELFVSRTGLDVLHVPYRDSAQPAIDLSTKRLDLLIANLGSVKALVDAGDIRPIGVSSLDRFVDLPEAHTFAEDGVASFDVTTYYGIAGPRGLPDDIVVDINRAVAGIMADPQAVARLRSLFTYPLTSTPQDFSTRIASEVASWTEVVRLARVERI